VIDIHARVYIWGSNVQF